MTTLLTNPLASRFLPRDAAPPPVQLASAPAATYRVLVAVPPGASAARLAGAGTVLAGGRRPLELIVASPVELPDSTIPSGLADEEADVRRTLSGLVPLAAIVGGPDVTVSYQTPEVADDFLRLADAHAPDLVVTGVRSGDGGGAERATALASGSPAPTAIVYDPTGEGLYAGMAGPVLASDGTAAVGAQLAEGGGSTLAAEAPGGAGVLVIPMVDGWEDTLASARCPVVVVAEAATVRVPASAGR